MERDPSSGTDDTVAATVDDAATRPTTTEPSLPRSFARFRADSVIGRGGMGEVVSARDEKIGRSVAIKRLRSGGDDAEVIARFLREARVQGRLEHPAIVPVYELHDDGGQPFFVMKQLAGTTLHDVIAAGKVGRPQLLRAFVDVCLAIEFAHTRGVIHRDLKPANIMLGDFGEVYVLDWGLARVVGDEVTRASFADIDSIEGGATVAGSVLGTPGYMSPEQIRGDADLDGRTDVYALGCVLFEILAGKPLHPHGQAGLASALAGIDARASRAAPDVPPELDAVCVQATALERAARFASARSLADAVQRFLDGDRDLVVRRELARSELERAREALARGDHADARADAIRAAARALALDPHAREPAELVGRLMLEPPKDTPPEVEVELDAVDRADVRGQAVRAGWATLGFAVFLPVMYVAGLRDTWAHVTLGTLILGVFLSAWFVDNRRVYAHMVFACLADAVIVAVVAREMTPLLVAPGLTAIIAGLYANNSRQPAWSLYLIFVAAALLPWLGEVVGVLPRTIEVVGHSLVLSASSDRLDPTMALLGLALWVASAPLFTVFLISSSAKARHRVERALHVQAWQLRQLVARP
jgi:serine/threonine-protein kinase